MTYGYNRQYYIYINLNFRLLAAGCVFSDFIVAMMDVCKDGELGRYNGQVQNKSGVQFLGLCYLFLGLGWISDENHGKNNKYFIVTSNVFWLISPKDGKYSWSNIHIGPDGDLGNNQLSYVGGVLLPYFY